MWTMRGTAGRQLTVDTRDGEDWQTCGDEMVAPPKTALKGSC